MMIAAMPLHRCWNDADESGRRGARLWPRRAGHRHFEIIVVDLSFASESRSGWGAKHPGSRSGKSSL